MKVISGLVGLVILALVLAFALSNPEDVTLRMWPYEEQLQLPLYLMGLVPLALGLVLGTLIGWLGSIPHRFRLNRLKKEMNSLHQRMHEMQKSANDDGLPPKPPSPKSAFWRRDP